MKSLELLQCVSITKRSRFPPSDGRYRQTSRKLMSSDHTQRKQALRSVQKFPDDGVDVRNDLK